MTVTIIAKTITAAALAGLTACGGTTSTLGDADTDTGPDSTDTRPDIPVDAPADTLPDVPLDTESEPDAVPPDCARWFLTDLAATGIRLADPAPLNTERTFRVAVETQMSGCQRRAMYAVRIDEEAMTVVVTLRAWDGVGMDCPTVLWFDTRYVNLRLPAVGTWTILDGSSGLVESLEVELGGGPPRPCASTSGMCEMDCDCPHDASVCLGAYGAGGWVTRCVHPCEHSMDCVNTRGRCVSTDDGLGPLCDPEQPACDDSTPCPHGYSCTGGFCEADFSLGASVRIECSCDDDCLEPMACTVPAPGDWPGRCEVLCPTGSPWWCAGMHRCGSRDEDLSGLALTDSVCGWMGE